MSAYHDEKDKPEIVGVNPAQNYSDDSEEEGVEDQNWDDWNDEDDGGEEQDLNSQSLCLFCDSRFSSCSSLFEHCAAAHSFDFYGIRKSYKLDFYKCFKLINYIRSQVTVNKFWSWAVDFSGNSFAWDDDKYLNPFLEDDSLLYSFDDDDEDGEEDGDAMSIDKEELASYASQFEKIDIHDEDVSDICGSEPSISCENGGNDVNTAKPLETVTVNGINNVEGGILSCRNGKSKMCSVPPSPIAANEIKNINKNYFGSYGHFGIHRDMISDKVRTDSYRQAIVENPSLLRNAVVMDVGCGTGILSLFAAQAGASRVFAVEASDKMAAVASEIAKDNGLLRTEISHEGGKQSGVIEVVHGMVEELGNANHIQPQSVDVLVSEWMGYCLHYESMLLSVLYARDKWLKPGGAVLPDTATMFVAGFGRGATSVPFWENVYGFNMSCIGQEVVEDAARVPIIDVVDSCNIVTATKVVQAFDLVTMQPNQMDFTSEVELEPKSDALTWCYGFVVWFETGFTERFCREKPVILSTSPYDPSTHWSQTILTFREPIAMALNGGGEKLAPVGTNDCPAARIQSRISIVRAPKHRTIDISLELTGIGSDGQKRSWPVQIFNLN